MAQVEFIVVTVTVILSAAWIIGRFVVAKPATRDLLWRTVLVFIAVTPAISFFRGTLTDWQWAIPVLAAADPVEEIERHASDAAPVTDEAMATPKDMQHMILSPVKSSRAEYSRAAVGTVPPVETDVPQSSSSTSLDTAPNVDEIVVDASPITFLAALSAVWFAGFCFHSFRILRGAWRARRLLAESQPVSDPQLLELSVATAHRVGLKRSVCLATSAAIQSPIVSGIVRPQILVPPFLTALAARNQLRAALLHECGHIRRQDIAFELLLKIVNAIFWPHPLIYVMAVELRRLREELCDNYVLADESPVAYAETLLQLSVGKRLSESGLIGVGMFSRRHRLEDRVDSILSPSRSLETNARRAVRLSILCATIVAVLALMLIRLERAAAAPPDAEVKAVETEQPKADAKPAPEKTNKKSTHKPIEVEIHVTNTAGKPVFGATVTPWGLSGGGGSFTFEEKSVVPAKTDESGVARIVFTERMESVTNSILGKPAKSRIISIAVKIEHPDHPIWSEYLGFGRVNPIVLSDSMTVTIRAHRDGESQNATRLYPLLSRSTGVDWSEADGVLTVRRLDVSGEHACKWLRVVQVPEQGAPWFSPVVDLTKQPGNPIVLDLTLQPAVRMEGRLDASVPRPIKNGHVRAIAASGGDPRANCIWNAAAEISPDGTFVLESLPPQENLQLLALCDGWVSRTPTQEEIKAYADKYDIQLGRWDVSAGQVCPMFFRIEREIIRPEVAMERTATCEVTVVDQESKPIANASVHFWPNQIFHSIGSTHLGAGFDATAYIRSVLASNDHGKVLPRIEYERNYMAQTDAKGIATIANLPAAGSRPETFRQVQFLVTHEKYGAVPNYQLPTGASGMFSMPMLTATLEPGKLGHVTVHMVPQKNPIALSVGADEKSQKSQPNEEPAIEAGVLSGVVVDQMGQPVEGVEVQFMLFDQFKIRTDRLGRFYHKFAELDEVAELDEDSQLVSVRFVKPGFAPYLESEWRLGAENRSVMLDNKTWFEGVVRKPDGTPAANVLIRGEQDGGTLDCMGVGPVFTETRTDSAGRYKLLVQPGDFAFNVRDAAAGSVRLPKSENTANLDFTFYVGTDEYPAQNRFRIASGEHKSFDIQLERAVDVQFHFVDSVIGKPVQGVSVESVYQNEIDERSDASGKLILQALPVGQFTFSPYASGYLRASSNDSLLYAGDANPANSNRRSSKRLMSDGFKLELKAGMPVITMVLEPAATISGRVLDPDGRPVADASVAIVHPTDKESTSGVGPPSWSTDKEGRFKVTTFSSEGAPHYLLAHDGQYAEERRIWANGVSQPMETSAGQHIENIEVRLTRPGVIRGRVVDRGGRPAPAVDVQSRALDRFEGSVYSPTAKTDREGNFELRFVRPGRHAVLGGKVNDSEKTPALSPVVNVSAGETTSIGEVLSNERH